jgi:hypothetical protein
LTFSRIGLPKTTTILSKCFKYLFCPPAPLTRREGAGKKARPDPTRAAAAAAEGWAENR